MRQRGRKSASALSIVVENGTIDRKPLAPVPGLSEAEAAVWETTVGSKPVEWFGPEHIPVLVEYTRAVCRAHVVDQFIKALDEPYLGTSEGLARLERLSAMALKTANVIARLATNMRLTQQASYQPNKVWTGVTKASERKVWQHAGPGH
jgi:hypothetical protein